MKILGASGQVCHDSMHTLAKLGDMVGVNRAQMCLASPQAIERTVRAVAPELIVDAVGPRLVARITAGG